MARLCLRRKWSLPRGISRYWCKRSPNRPDRPSRYIPFAELVDISQEIERLEKEEKKLQGELARVNGMLNNEKFISKAPETKIAEEKAKLEKYTQMMEQVKERLVQLRK